MAVKKTELFPLLTHVAISEKEDGRLITVEGDVPTQRWRPNEWDPAVCMEAGIWWDVDVRTRILGNPGSEVGPVGKNTTSSFSAV